MLINSTYRTWYTNYNHIYTKSKSSFGGDDIIYELWTPAEISTVAWYDAGDSTTITQSEGSVTQWNDKSVDGNHATTEVGSEQPIYANSEIYFDGENDILKLSNDPLSGLQLPTIFVVGRWDGLASDAYGNNMVARPEVRLGNAYPDTLYFRSGGSFLINRFNQPQSALFDDFIGVGFTESATIMRTRLNGVITDSLTDRGNPLEFAGTNRSALGANCLADNWTSREEYYNGWMKEVIVVNEVDSATVEKIEGYLAWKWGLTANLPSDHPYKDDPPTK